MIKHTTECISCTPVVYMPANCVNFCWMHPVSRATANLSAGENKLPLLRRYTNSVGERRRVVSFIITATRSLVRYLSLLFHLFITNHRPPASSLPLPFRFCFDRLPPEIEREWEGPFSMIGNAVPRVVYTTALFFNDSVWNAWHTRLFIHIPVPIIHARFTFVIIMREVL